MTSHRLVPYASLIAAASIVAGGIGFYWHYCAVYPSTDDAYVQANTIDVASQDSGKVIAVYVSNDGHVNKGDKLFDLDPIPFQLALTKAQADLALAQQNAAAGSESVKVARAELAKAQVAYRFAQQNSARTTPLVEKGVASRAEGDAVKTKLDEARATLNTANSQLKLAIEKLGETGEKNSQVIAAKAALDKAQWDFDHTTTTAAASGIISNFSLRVGSTVSAGAPVFSLVEDQEWWVKANFKETQLGRIAPGQLVTINVDLYPHHSFVGRVTSIGAGSGAAFSLLPAENASGNWVKVTQRFPVKISFINPDPHFALRLGASATVSIDTHSGLTQNELLRKS